MKIDLNFLQVIKENAHHITVYEVKEAYEDDSNGLITIKLTGNKVIRIPGNIEK
jgi:hypothetical protein